MRKSQCGKITRDIMSKTVTVYNVLDARIHSTFIKYKTTPLLLHAVFIKFLLIGHRLKLCDRS